MEGPSFTCVRGPAGRACRVVARDSAYRLRRICTGGESVVRAVPAQF